MKLKVSVIVLSLLVVFTLPPTTIALTDTTPSLSFITQSHYIGDNDSAEYPIIFSDINQQASIPMKCQVDDDYTIEVASSSSNLSRYDYWFTLKDGTEITTIDEDCTFYLNIQPTMDYFTTPSNSVWLSVYLNGTEQVWADGVVWFRMGTETYNVTLDYDIPEFERGKTTYMPITITNNERISTFELIVETNLETTVRLLGLQPTFYEPSIQTETNNFDHEDIIGEEYTTLLQGPGIIWFSNIPEDYEIEIELIIPVPDEYDEEFDIQVTYQSTEDIFLLERNEEGSNQLFPEASFVTEGMFDFFSDPMFVTLFVAGLFIVMLFSSYYLVGTKKSEKVYQFDESSIEDELIEYDLEQK